MGTRSQVIILLNFTYIQIFQFSISTNYIFIFDMSMGPVKNAKDYLCFVPACFFLVCCALSNTNSVSSLCFDIFHKNNMLYYYICLDM